MNKRQLFALLAPFGDEAEFLICVHKSRDDVIVRPPLLDVGITNDSGRAIVHVDIQLEPERKLRAIDGGPT